MIEFKEEKMSKLLENLKMKQEARMQKISEITDQEIMEQLGREEPEEIEQDVIFAYLCKNPESFYTLCGFTKDEFEKLFEHLSDSLTNAGRGRKAKISPRDILLVVLYYIRRYPRVEEASSMFSLKPSTLQGIITKYIPIIADVMNKTFILQMTEMDIPYDQRFPDCGYVVDATVQEINKPGINFEEAKQYFSGKHYLYCLKSQVTVNIKGLAVHIVTGIKGATHDKKVFDDSLKELKEIINKHPDAPGKIIADKGYQETGSDILVTPFKGNSALLTREQLVFNQKLGEVRIIVENFFGRLKSRYEIMSSKYRGCHELYSNIFILCCALVNFEQIAIDHPLRESDSRFYQKFQTSIQIKIKEDKEKRKHKRKQQAKLRRKIYDFNESSENSISSDS